jgi:antitoxin component YwqK of YwqJK toxin-antitoxin module
MKFTLLISLFILFYTELYSQNFTITGDCDSVEYKPYENEDDLDSIIVPYRDGSPVFCEMVKVYFDTSQTKIAFEGFSTGDSYKTINYWRNGKVKSINIHTWDNSKQFYLRVWNEIYCKNGQLIRKSNPNNTDDELIINYYCNGQKKNEFYFSNYRIKEKMTWWYENRQKMYEEFYDENQKKSGEWNEWTIDGKLIKTQVYKNDSLISVFEY